MTPPNSITRRRFVQTTFAAATGIFLARHGFAESVRRPNILLIIADDWGWGDASAYGNPGIKTPHFDRIAREGALFQRAYCAAPTCTASRASLLTGQMFYRLEAAAHLHGPLDQKFAAYPEILQQAGYTIGCKDKGLGPLPRGVTGGRPHNPAGPSIKDLGALIEQIPQDQPFCCWVGSNFPHRPYTGEWLARAFKPEKATVPPFLPDSAEVRKDVALYSAAVEAFDHEIGKQLKVLEQTGRLDDTIIVVTSDNGMPFPRAKGNLYDSGTRMPLAIRWGARIKPGQVIDELVSLTDLAPTFLEAAGLPVPEDMTGRSLLGLMGVSKSSGIEGRDFAVVGRERHGYSDYPCRAIHTKDYVYIRNYRPESSPALADPGLTLDYYNAHRDDPEMARYWAMYDARRPAEELYERSSDPDQLINVAGDPRYARVLENLSAKLTAYLQKTQDPRETGQGQILDNYPNRSPHGGHWPKHLGG